MLYLVALLAPPLAILLCWKPFQFIFNSMLYSAALLIAVGSIGIGLPLLFIPLLHALFVVHNYYADGRQKRMIDALRAEPREYPSPTAVWTPTTSLPARLEVRPELPLSRLEAGATSSFTCPACGLTSYHAEDIANRYCSCCGNPSLPKNCGHHFTAWDRVVTRLEETEPNSGGHR